MGRMSDLNDLPRSHDVTDPTTCAWPAQEIAAAEAPVTAGTDRYMRAAAHAVARAALRELRQGTGNAGAAVAPARPVPAPLTSMSPMGVAATPASPLSPATPLRGAGEAAGTQTGPGWISGAPVLLLVGGGHNGADTLLAGGLLAHSGCAVSAVLATEHPHPVALEEARGHGVTIHGAGYRSDDGTGQDSAEAVAAIEAFLVHGGLVLDGLTGIGATGALRPDAAALIAPLIAAGEPGRRPLRVIAVDLPSGTGVDDGTVSGPVLAADHTVTFTCLKGCQCLPPARHLCGVVEVVPLGLPAPTSRPLARRPVDGALGDYLTRAAGEPGPAAPTHTPPRRGINLKSLHEAIDTTTPTGRLMVHLIASLAEFERELTIERTIAGLEAAKARGTSLGRPTVWTPQRAEAARALLAAGATVTQVAHALNVSRATVYRHATP